MTPQLTKEQSLKYAAISALLWLGLIGLVKMDKALNRHNSSQLNAFQTLRRSSFARGMFLDVGILSFLASTWAKNQSNQNWNKGFAFVILWAGSFAFLPFLTVHFLVKALRPNATNTSRVGL